MVAITGMGLVSPAAALGVAPGVKVRTQALAAAMLPQLDGDMVVPAGNAGDSVYPTDVAVALPVLVIVIVRAVPVKAGDSPVSDTATASDETLVASVVVGTRMVMAAEAVCVLSPATEKVV
jgi:hypothetical protein